MGTAVGLPLSTRDQVKKWVGLSAPLVAETEADGFQTSRRYQTTTFRKATMSIPLSEKLAAVAIAVATVATARLLTDRLRGRIRPTPSGLRSGASGTGRT